MRKKTLASLTWKRLAKDSNTQTIEHSSSRSRFVSWKILAQIGNEVIKMNLCWTTKMELKRRRYGLKINLHGVVMGLS